MRGDGRSPRARGRLIERDHDLGQRGDRLADLQVTMPANSREFMMVGREVDDEVGLQDILSYELFRRTKQSQRGNGLPL